VEVLIASVVGCDISNLRVGGEVTDRVTNGHVIEPGMRSGSVCWRRGPRHLASPSNSDQDAPKSALGNAVVRCVQDPKVVGISRKDWIAIQKGQEPAELCALLELRDILDHKRRRAYVPHRTEIVLPQFIQGGSGLVIAVATERGKALAGGTAQNDVRWLETFEVFYVSVVHSAAKVAFESPSSGAIVLYCEDGREPRACHLEAKAQSPSSGE
jgi:hypothetical protein